MTEIRTAAADSPKENNVVHELERKPISIVALIDALIRHAHAVRASDIHIDPIPTAVRVRLRIDGVLHDRFSFPKEIHAEVIARIKVLAGLRSDEHFATQDGRFRFEGEGKEVVDVRVSIAPLYHGENAVLRLLANRIGDATLQTLGLSSANIAQIHTALRKPHGMILATGPTGSGKTTMLYALLTLLNDPSVSIITIEDPIEYAIEGIKQIPVRERSGLTFAKGLRSILRQDPDIIMVGEIRDSETAGIAVSAALTGHLLFSTLHTKDAAATLPRLLDMGIEPYLVASTISVVIGQRLVRKICTSCSRQGCTMCGGSGYRGRVAIHEVLVADDAITEAIMQGMSAGDIRTIACKNGMVTMHDDGLAKAHAGITSVEEVMRVIYE